MSTPEDVVLPCGCYLTHSVVAGVKTLQIARQGCVNLRNALGLADELGKPVERRAS